MAISRIRGEQIKPGIIKDEHIASDAAISESKLSIDWQGHYHAALQTKKVVDFIQVNGTNVGGLSSFDATNAIGANIPAVSSDPLSGEGVIVDPPKNKVIIRNHADGENILDPNNGNAVVYGRVTYDNGVYTVSFYSEDANGNEVPFTMPPGMVIDWQYARRFNLDTVSEMFAANEKFVDGVADATAYLDIHQLAKDIYGSQFQLNRDGNPILSTSLVDQIANEAAARMAADNQIRSDLSSTQHGKGASTIGVEDAGNHFTGTTVEDVLTEIGGRLEQLAAGGGATGDEVMAARTTSVAKDGNGQPITEASLEARLAADFAAVVDKINAEESRAQQAESNLQTALNNEIARAQAAEQENANNIASLQTALNNEVSRAQAAEADLQNQVNAVKAQSDADHAEITAARGSKASLGERLDVALNPDGTLKAGRQIHTHYKAQYQAVGGESVVPLSAFNRPNLPPYQVGDDSLDVYVNGLLQNVGLHYAESPDGLSIDFGMGDGTTLVAGDVVTIKYYVNNAS